MYNNFMKIILASASPRRYEILKNAGFELEVIPSNYDEKINGLNFSEELVENCAYQKALEVKNRISKNEIVVAADTVVVNNGVILGKPKNEDEAFDMLADLSNKTHFVATSVCVIFEDKVFKNTDKTYVTFKKLSKEEIVKYIKNKKPLDKAGSYGIQDEGFDFALSLEGELDNVIGFPMKCFLKMLTACTDDKQHRF